MIRLRENRLEDAFGAQRRAVSRQPDEPRQYLLLSNILEKWDTPMRFVPRSRK